MSFRPKKASGLTQFEMKANGKYASVIRFELRHGDHVVMHGRGIHALYEVCARTKSPSH